MGLLCRVSVEGLRVRTRVFHRRSRASNKALKLTRSAMIDNPVSKLQRTSDGGR